MRVLIVAADLFTRARLAALLSGQQDVSVAEAAPDADLIAMAEAYDPDVIMWDLGADAVGAVAALPTIQALDAPVVVLGNDEVVAAAAVAAGVRGVLLRETDGPALLTALQAVAHELVVIDPSFTRDVVPARGGERDAPGDDLTPREREVLQLLAEGLPNKQIARRLGVSEHTVKFHVNTIFSKLGAHSRTEAVTRAARRGLIVL